MEKNVVRGFIIMTTLMFTKGNFVSIRSWKADKINGQGTLFMKNGDIYKGEWYLYSYLA